MRTHGSSSPRSWMRDPHEDLLKTAQLDLSPAMRTRSTWRAFLSPRAGTVLTAMRRGETYKKRHSETGVPRSGHAAVGGHVDAFEPPLLRVLEHVVDLLAHVLTAVGALESRLQSHDGLFGALLCVGHPQQSQPLAVVRLGVLRGELRGKPGVHVGHHEVTPRLLALDPALVGPAQLQVALRAVRQQNGPDPRLLRLLRPQLLDLVVVVGVQLGQQLEGRAVAGDGLRVLPLAV
mmetsp:Transcript_52671/g.128687  ORF Transcript_52671/g.128687 Transcript_52671/m.128687 type:complete len:234 (+) Transcript_52671:226-927(+)